MISMTALLLVGVMMPPNIDPRTGKLMPTRPAPIAATLHTVPLLSEDTVPIRLYRLDHGNYVATPYGLGVGEDGNEIWFLASWTDTIRAAV